MVTYAIRRQHLYFKVKLSTIIGAVVVIIVWWLDLHLPMQSVPITTNIVSSNPAHDEEFSIQHYVIKFVSDLRFPPPINLTATIILLKVALNTISLTPQRTYGFPRNHKKNGFTLEFSIYHILYDPYPCTRHKLYQVNTDLLPVIDAHFTKLRCIEHTFAGIKLTNLVTFHTSCMY